MASIECSMTNVKKKKQQQKQSTYHFLQPRYLERHVRALYLEAQVRLTQQTQDATDRNMRLTSAGWRILNFCYDWWKVWSKVVFLKTRSILASTTVMKYWIFLKASKHQNGSSGMYWFKSSWTTIRSFVLYILKQSTDVLQILNIQQLFL